MEERYSKKGLGTFLEEQNELTKKKQSQSAGAPWWLVIVLVLGLLGSVFYVAWMNSDLVGDRRDFLPFFLKPRTSGTQIVVPESDSLAVWENSLLNANALDSESTAQEWHNNLKATTGIPDTALTRVPPSFSTIPPPVPEATPVPAVPGYYIKAGEFRSRRSALFRVSELRQGNYWAKIIEPDSSGGVFIVSAGEYKSFKKARAQARTIGFILDIRTSVVEK